MFLSNLRCSLFICVFGVINVWMQLTNAESFRPIINPIKQITTTPIPHLTTVSRSQSPILTKQSPIKYNDNIYTESKDIPVAEALRRDPISRNRRRQRKPYKRYHSYNYSRPRRRPKPFYGPPGYSYGPPINDYRFESDAYDGRPFTTKSKKKEYQELNSKDYGIVDTDIGKFYDSSSASFHVGSFKTSDASSYYGTSTGVDGSDFEDVGNYKLSSSNSADENTGYRPAAPSAPSVPADNNQYKFNGYSSDVPLTGTDNSPDYKYSGTGAAQSEPSGPYPPSATNFDLNKFSFYSPQTQTHTIYQTAPRPSSQQNQPKTPSITPIRFGENNAPKQQIASNTFDSNTDYKQQINYNPINSNYKQQQQQQQRQPPQQPPQQQPPSTSYGVPIAPVLTSYTYQSSYQGIQNPSVANTNGYLPANTLQQQQTNYISPASISITKSQEVGVQLPEGHFAEPPSINVQELSEVDDQLYKKPQTSYDASPKSRRPTVNSAPSKAKRRPNKVNSKRVSTTPTVVLNTDEELDYDDDLSESYVVHKTMPQPALPNSYDQEQFHTFIKEKRKLIRQPQTNFNKFEEYSPNFDGSEISRTSRKPKQTTVADDVTESNFEIPDDDFVDDLVKLQTTKQPKPPIRPKRPTKSTTPHILDTDDLRDAFEADTDIFSIPSKSRRNTHRNRYTNHQEQQYEYDDDTDSNERISVNIKQTPKSHRKRPLKLSDIEQGTLTPPTWDTESFYKNYGIRARNDNFQFNSGFRPIIGEDRSDLFHENLLTSKGTPVHDIGIVADESIGERISSTLRSIVTPRKPSTLYVWDGNELPKNHKMA